jgi:hypothetical protein
MNSWLIWGVFAVVVVLLGWVGYHFTMRTLRFVTLVFVVAVVVLVTRCGVTHLSPTTPAAPADLVNAFTRGLDNLSGAFFQPLLPGPDVLEPGRVGWLVIIVFLAFAYRELEVWAMRWQPPAVDTSALGGDEPGPLESGAPGGDRSDRQRGHDELVAELRFRLPAVEVRAPPILPGGATPNGLASIAENSGVDGGGLAGAIIRLAGMLWPSPRRYQVRVCVEPSGSRAAVNSGGDDAQRQAPHTGPSARGSEPGTASRRVTVDLEDAQTGGSIMTKTLAVPDWGNAAAVVAAYVARQIFREDPTVPPWSVGSFDGSDLAALLSTEQHRVSHDSNAEVKLARRQRIRILEKAVANSPGAGVARYELAQLRNLEGDHVEALRLHAINREQYPRFYRGRYRLAMSLEMIASPGFEPLDDKDRRRLRASLDILDRCGVTSYPAGGRKVPAVSPEEAGRDITAGLRKELLTAAGNELRACRRQLTFRRVIWATFWHRDERAVRKPYWRLRERQRFGDGARVAELLVAVRQSLNEPERGGRNDREAAKEYRRARKAIRITAVITGDNVTIKEVLKNRKIPDSPIPLPKAWHPGSYVGKTRWLPWQRRTPSWQTAYNTACLYAALACSSRDPENEIEMAHRAVGSLRSAVGDRHCEMERPSDWISKDPDLCCLKSSEFAEFLRRQKKKDYPSANPEPNHHRHLAHRDGAQRYVAIRAETKSA